MSSKSSSETRTTRTTIRRWIRAEEPREGWWPWGILPLVGLLLAALIAFFYVAPSKVEAETQKDAETQLAIAGYDALAVEADGQQLVVSGVVNEPVTEQLKAKVAAAAMSNDCEWFGCDVRVELEGGAATKIAKPASKPASKPRLHDFTFESNGRSIVLRGEVANAATRDAVGEQANKHFDAVDNQLVVSKEMATAGYPLSYMRAVPLLRQLESGKAMWNDGKFSVRGVVSQENDAPAKAAFAVADKAPPLGDIVLEVGQSADTCDAQFAAALSTSTIRFQSGSAVIAASSRPLLRKLADTAKACPGTIGVEGHTDSVGKLEMNMNLSRNRAKAVVTALGALGVDTNRLEAEGFGPTKPIAPNTTAAGKAKNRRIEIRVKR